MIYKTYNKKCQEPHLWKILIKKKGVDKKAILIQEIHSHHKSKPIHCQCELTKGVCELWTQNEKVGVQCQKICSDDVFQDGTYRVRDFKSLGFILMNFNSLYNYGDNTITYKWVTYQYFHKLGAYECVNL